MYEVKTQVLPRNYSCAQNIILMVVLLSAIQDLLFKRLGSLETVGILSMTPATKEQSEVQSAMSG